MKQINTSFFQWWEKLAYEEKIRELVYRGFRLRDSQPLQCGEFCTQDEEKEKLVIVCEFVEDQNQMKLPLTLVQAMAV